MRWILCLLVAAASANVRADEIRVFAAASLSDALGEIGRLYTAATGDSVRLNLGGSGTLARQIKEGAPADVFFSADERRMDDLERAGLLLADSRQTLLRNSLVVIVPRGAGLEVRMIDDLNTEAVRRIAVGEPSTVPAGTYAKEALESHGVWKPLRRKLVPLENVRSVLAAVASGNADAGFVYRTDVSISKDVRVAVEVPIADGPRITYPAAVLREARHPGEARRFLAFLAGREAQEVFAKFGFLPPN